MTYFCQWLYSIIANDKPISESNNLIHKKKGPSFFQDIWPVYTLFYTENDLTNKDQGTDPRPFQNKGHSMFKVW